MTFGRKIVHILGSGINTWLSREIKVPLFYIIFTIIMISIVIKLLNSNRLFIICACKATQDIYESIGRRQQQIGVDQCSGGKACADDTRDALSIFHMLETIMWLFLYSDFIGYHLIGYVAVRDNLVSKLIFSNSVFVITFFIIYFKFG